MSTIQNIVILLGLAAALVAVVVGGFQVRRQALRRRFGAEYDRAVSEQAGRGDAERELRGRRRRHADLELKTLTAQSRAWYAEQWQRLQDRFVDAPLEAASAAGELVARLVAERGYPAVDHEQLLALLSVKHARVVDEYRQAHTIVQRSTGATGNTEQLRQAVVHYRAVATELLGADPVAQPGIEDTPQHKERTP